MISVKPRRHCAAAALAALLAAGAARAEDRLLDETVAFSGAIAFLGMDVPGMVIAAYRNGETAFAGFGETAGGSGQAPTADTLMRIGSVSKVFCGATLASMVADGEIGLADAVQDRIGDGFAVPARDGRTLRIVDLATHASGLAREVAAAPGPDDDPFSTNTREAQAAGLAGDPYLFAPGTGVLYSNYGFDLLGAALAHAGGKPYAELLQERVLAPNGMNDTVFTPRPEDRDRLMQGHGFDGAPLPFAPTPATIECAGGLYSTPNDILRWMRWHLDPAGAASEMRLIDHAAWLYRDGLDPVAGVDDGGGDMDAMGLGWVVMLAEGNRPLILHKSGGLQGMFAFLALAPARGLGVFAAINAFSVPGFLAMVDTVNALIAELAPR
jgi:D-alanyl-D-alanine-carboxypeptidase/D-alanyl-D-alanine-endopeptidase